MAKVPLNEYKFPQNKIADVQRQLESLISKNHYLNVSARDGYRSYLQAYASYSLKKIFDVNKLDLAKVGKAFGFAIPPKVNISVGSIKAKKTVDSDSDDDGVRANKAFKAGGDDGEVKKAYYRNRGHKKGGRA